MTALIRHTVSVFLSYSLFSGETVCLLRVSFYFKLLTASQCGFQKDDPLVTEVN